MNKLIVIEQGDVVLIRRDGATRGGIPKANRTNVVQDGEHTGHAHRFTTGEATIYETNGLVTSLKVTSPKAFLTHEEHLPVEIEEGEYEVRIVRQKDPFTKMISRVVD
jgi:hypothetical protein